MARTKATVAPASDRKWEVEDALHCMTRAEEIRRNPKLMEDVKKLAAEKKSTLQRVAATSPRVTKSSPRK